MPLSVKAEVHVTIYLPDLSVWSYWIANCTRIYTPNFDWHDGFFESVSSTCKKTPNCCSAINFLIGLIFMSRISQTHLLFMLHCLQADESGGQVITCQPALKFKGALQE